MSLTQEEMTTAKLLSESREILTEAQEIARLGNWVWDIPNNKVTWSAEMYRIYGYEPGAFEVNFEKAMERVDPEDAERINANVSASFSSGVDHAASEIEYRITIPGGIHKVLLGRGRLSFDAGGRPVRMVGTVQDITERKNAEEAVRRAYEREKEAGERLREADEIKNAFLSAVSHDLRTPLTAISGFAKTIDRHLKELPEETVRDLIGRVRSNADRLERILVNLLDLDRLSRGTLEARKEPVELSGLIARIVLGVEMKDRPVTLELEPVTIEADPAQIERIVENLIANSARHTAPATPVRVKLQPVAEGALLAVEDAGDGVPDELKESIFLPFKQGASPKSGSGIGLSLVARFATLHGGRAWVEDRPGGGASFKVLLPV